jgi:hypothetical protein
VAGDAEAERIEVPIGETSLEIRRELRAVDDLRLDPDNPRVASMLPRRGRRRPSQEELERRLWNLPQVRALAQSILQNGGLLEDPVARHDGTLVEGNCRTVALRHLRREHPHDERFARAYVRVLPPDVTDVQIALLLGDLHIAQKIPWRAYDQAAYVWRMHVVHGVSEAFLATHLRWTPKRLAAKLAAYEETRAYGERTGDTALHQRFALFEEACDRPELRRLRARDPSFLERFGDWVREGRLATPRQVRELPQILADDEAREAFESEGAEAALRVLGRRDPTRDMGLYWYLQRAAEKLEGMPLRELEALRAGEAPRLELLRRLAGALRQVEEVAGVPLASPPTD